MTRPVQQKYGNENIAKALTHLFTSLLDVCTAKSDKDTKCGEAFKAFESVLKAELSVENEQHHAFIEFYKTIKKQTENTVCQGMEDHSVFDILAYQQDLLRELCLAEIAECYGLKRDSVTGLKHESSMFADLDREKQRAARGTSKFTLTLIRFDQRLNDIQRSDEMRQKFAKHISQAVRGFDDVYGLQNGDIFCILKEVDLPLASAFVQRIQKDFERYQIENPIIEGEMFTFSVCLSCPMSSEDNKNIMHDLEQDLKELMAKTSNDFSFVKEVSPLQRYIQSQAK